MLGERWRVKEGGGRERESGERGKEKSGERKNEGGPGFYHFWREEEVHLGGMTLYGIPRGSTSELEIDIFASDILNIRPLYHGEVGQKTEAEGGEGEGGKERGGDREREGEREGESMCLGENDSKGEGEKREGKIEREGEKEERKEDGGKESAPLIRSLLCLWEEERERRRERGVGGTLTPLQSPPHKESVDGERLDEGFWGRFFIFIFIFVFEFTIWCLFCLLFSSLFSSNF